MKKVKIIHQGYFVFLSLLFVSLAHAGIPADLMKSAENGKASAQYTIARSYELGNRVKSDNAKAILWYTKAAKQGHVDAAYRLGLLYYKGIGGFKIDLKKAFHFISLAANKNHKNSQANLAKMYENGDGVARNEELSDYWYEQAFTAKLQPFSEYLKEQARLRSSEADSTKSTQAPVAEKKVWKANPPSSTKKKKIRFPKTITNYQWFKKGKASVYLNSSIVQCKSKRKKLTCSSSKLKGMHSTGMYKYKIKSIIKGSRNSKDIEIVYRKLYTAVPEESEGGYDDEEDESANKQQLVLGWEKKSHRISCQFESAKKILCRPVGEDAFYIKAK